MSSAPSLDRFFDRFPAVAVAGYVVLVFAFLVASWAAVADIFERFDAVRAARDLVAQIEGRRPLGGVGADTIGAIPEGSPFLEGDTITVAGASLLQRVAGAVTRVGGNVLSSQVELQGPESAEGYVGLIVSCEVEQPVLQQLLYDIESGMPFLFINQLVVQPPQGAATPDGGRMRVLLSISGQWKDSK